MVSTLEIGRDPDQPELVMVRRNGMLVGLIPLGSPDMPDWAEDIPQNVLFDNAQRAVSSTLIQLLLRGGASSKVASAVRQRVEAHKSAQGGAQPSPAEDDAAVAQTLLTMQRGEAGSRKRKLPEPDTLAEALVSLLAFVCDNPQQ